MKRKILSSRFLHNRHYLSAIFQQQQAANYLIQFELHRY